ncbi:MAG: hypothetical protein M1840_007227 [Geoglossum simile]|nr:MAG: hypothetical protein M1840_007227 [Geoglossum simile]
MSELLDFILNREDQFRTARLPSLYSDFRRLRTTNPDGYAINISAWRMALAHAARAGLIPAQGPRHDLLVLRFSGELQQALETKQWGQPLALGTVINEAVARREMFPLKDFLVSTESIYNRSWVITPWQAISWSLRQLGIVGGASQTGNLSLGRFVVLANVEEAANAIRRQMSGRTNRVDRVFSKDMFTKEFPRVLGGMEELSDSDFAVLLTFLARDKREIAFDGKTIKFKAPSDSVITITTEDTTIASLKSIIADLSQQISSLAFRIDTLSTVARNAVSGKNRVSALASLRSKKIAETTLSRRSETLAQLEQVYTNIERAVDQVEIVRVMEASTAVLKGLHAEVGGAERVEQVVEELREEMGNVGEVGEIIAEAGDPSLIVDDEEVDDELEAMEREEKEKKDEAEAQETARRLATLDKENIEIKKIAAEGEKRRQENVESQNGLEGSTAALGGMSLEEAQTTPTKPANDAIECTTLPAT